MSIVEPPTEGVNSPPETNRPAENAPPNLVLLAAAWDAGFNAAAQAILMATADAEARGFSATLRDAKPVPNPYRQWEADHG